MYIQIMYNIGLGYYNYLQNKKKKKIVSNTYRYNPLKGKSQLKNNIQPTCKI